MSVYFYEVVKERFTSRLTYIQPLRPTHCDTVSIVREQLAILDWQWYSMKLSLTNLVAIIHITPKSEMLQLSLN